VINQVKGTFQNGGELDSQWIADKISNSMFQAKYHDKMKIRVHLCRAPKFLVDPLEGPSMRQCGSGWNLGHDPNF
jgi:hypothetical protein